MGDHADDGTTVAPAVAARQVLMRVCSEASEEELEAGVASLDELPAYRDLRSPQTGLVMLRGAIGGTGAPFNFGEAIVTRAAVQLASGTIGFSYLLGPSHRRAQLAALVDALGQENPAHRERLEATLVARVEARRAQERAAARAEAAATKVDFFTLVRGED
jgi:alpha-D-ribose 1-methylphosphonate 5-triphosphate synthase subunit PhnG